MARQIANLTHPLPHTPRSRVAPRRRRAYSLLEMLITVLIVQIISSMVMVNVGSVQRTERLSRAAEQVQIAIRYARILGMSSGRQAGVEFDTSTNVFRVFTVGTDSSGATVYTTVPNSMMPGGQYRVDLNNNNDLSGVTIKSVAINGGSNPFRITYGTLGGVLNPPVSVETNGSAITGDVTLGCGVQTMTVRVYQVGEPKIK